MSMVTQCPSCATTFRVTPQQLQAQHGMVRCGRCAHIFDGFKTLATLRADTPLDAGPQPAGHEPGPAPESAAQPAVEITPQAEPATPEPSLHTLVPGPQPLPAAAAFAVEPLPQKRSGGWAFGALLLLLALAVQGAYLYRSEITASVPEARPYLNRMCELLHCTVALPQRPRQISIEASDMQATDPGNPGLIALTATLRNHATIEIGYPALDVVLTNTKEHTVARRIFLPGEYLDAGRNPHAGVPPNAEITVRLNLDTGDLGAAGFRLDLLAAPAR
jgi:predicted Zn finger-like uncharacterized protein